jgi:ATP-dependent DNA helicase DinG
MALKPFWAAQKSGQGAYLESAIFTSATLGNQSSNVASSMGAPFGISPQYHHIAECARFEPTEFGKLGFVVPGPECPAPVEAAQEEEEAPNISPEWYQYAAAMIEEAHGRGGRALVLTPSYRDVNELTTRLSGCDNEAILGHFRGLQLKSLIPAFRSLENAILITPAGWEGLDLPGLIDHLIIARIPFAPPDRVVQRVMYNRYVQQRNMRHGEAQKVIYGNDLMNTVNRVRQGIGRAIRKNDDAATVWIADPRFPWPSKLAKDVSLSAPRVGHKRKALLQSIPSRFRESGMDEAPWERAEVFTASLEPAD